MSNIQGAKETGLPPATEVVAIRYPHKDERFVMVFFRAIGSAFYENYRNTFAPIINLFFILPLKLAYQGIKFIAEKVTSIFKLAIESKPKEYLDQVFVTDDVSAKALTFSSSQTLNLPGNPAVADRKPSASDSASIASTHILPNQDLIKDSHSSRSTPLSTHDISTSDTEDLEDPSRPIPLGNIGDIAPNNCFINSAFQILLNNKVLLQQFKAALARYPFIQQVYEEEDSSKKERKLNAINGLNQLFESMLRMMNTSVKDRGPLSTFAVREFLAAFALDETQFSAEPQIPYPEIPDYIAYPQHDASEALNKLFYGLSDYLCGAGWNEYKIVEKLSEDRFVVADASNDAVAVSRSGNDFYTLSDDKGLNTISNIPVSTTELEEDLKFDKLIYPFFKEEYPASEIDSVAVKDNYYKPRSATDTRPSKQLPDHTFLGYDVEEVTPSFCLYRRTIRLLKFKEAPPFLFITVNRTKADGTKDTRVIEDVPLSYTLDTDHCESGDAEYDLQSFIVHLGASTNGASDNKTDEPANQTGGHYVSYVCKEGKWWFINDSTIKEVTDISQILNTQTITWFTYMKKGIEKDKILDS